MTDLKRVFISDVHMSSGAAVTPPPGQHAYGWLSPAKAKRLGAFLKSDELTDCRQLFLVGDIVDTWICPHDVKPPTAIEILDAPHNRPVVEGLKAFAAKPGNWIYWIEGNHDAGAGAEAAHHIAPNVSFVTGGLDDPPLYIHHGHENSLFNAPDPAGREFPLGYYISRFVATAAARGLAPVGLNLQLIWKKRDELLAFVKGQPLAVSVLNAVCDAAHINPNSPDEHVVMPDGSKPLVSKIREQYQNLTDDWEHSGLGSWKDALACEWDPFYSMGASSDCIYIMGHSHGWFPGGSPGMASTRYRNLGAWCGKEAHYATSYLEDAGKGVKEMKVTLSKWGPDIDE
ncbi:MAG TPA: hypothetical protein VF469_25190 [Kofleriaceae bacterium]